MFLTKPTKYSEVSQKSLILIPFFSYHKQECFLCHQVFRYSPHIFELGGIFQEKGCDMRFLVFLLGLACFACPSQIPQKVENPDKLEPLFERELPPKLEKVPFDKRVSRAVSECSIEGNDTKTGPGIYFSTEMALHAAKLKIAYDELRGLYEVDIRMMDRERAVYQKTLDIAEDEIAKLREASKRTWWERHGAQVTLILGVISGSAFAVGMAFAIDQSVE